MVIQKSPKQLVFQSCLSFFLRLETIVAEAVIVCRRLLQMASEENTRIAMSLVKSLNTITIPMARASILWLIGQYSTNPKMMKIAPDIFRQNVKTFSSSDEIVKLQVLNLGAKIVSVYQSLLLPTQNSSYTTSSMEDIRKVLSHCMKLFTYCLELAKFDTSYDIRDRARLLKSLVLDRIEITDTAIPLAVPLRDIMLKRQASSIADSPYSSKKKGGA
jgi:AP-3 complex subunit beta